MPPWRPGQSGNPGGRPKGRSLTSILREKLDDVEVCNQPCPDGRTVGETLIEAMVAQALKGDATLMRTILERIDGKVSDRPPIDGPEQPRRIEVPDVDPRFMGEGGCPAEEGDDLGPDAEGAADLRAGGDGQDASDP
jgi:hypothetical protein